jgi:cytidylate kinase
MNRYNLSHEDAIDLVKKTDNARARYLQKHYHVDWADPMLYHLVINTGMTMKEEARALIADAVRRMVVAANRTT